MRILSQDGMIDVPYEMVVIQQFKEKIYFLNKNLTGVEELIGDMELAKYSTKEKAEKAMEMLHEAYTGTFFAQNLELPEGGMDDLKQIMKHGYGCLTVVKDNSDARFEPLNICFQFPTDEEIEGGY